MTSSASKIILAPQGIWYRWFPHDHRHLFIEPTHEGYAKRAAKIIIEALQEILEKKKYAVVVPSAGKSPMSVYALLRSDYRRALDWSRIVLVQMDEYWSAPDIDPVSFAYFLKAELVMPLGIHTFLHFFDEKGDFSRSLVQYETAIRELGGIDVVVHGIGCNGHIGFNEPGSSWRSRTRKVTLSPLTVEANFIGSLKSYSQAVTLGLGLLTTAAHVVLLISGERKREVTEKLFMQKPSKMIPASCISINPIVDCVIDSESVFGNAKPLFI